MKRRLLIIAITLLFSGCSFTTNFYIINTTEEPIYISYETVYYSSDMPFITEPIIMNYKKGKFKTLDSSFQSVITVNEKKVNCSLKPNQALFIGTDINFTLSNPSEAAMISSSLKHLEIKQNDNVLVDVKGSEVIPYFKQDHYSEVILMVD